MKVRIMMAIVVAISLSSQAQIKEGTITYERKVNVWKRITDEQMRAMIPEFRTSKHILFFNDSTSLYRMLPEDEAPDPFAGGPGGGNRVIFRAGGGSDGGDLYKNFANNTSVQSTELGGKNFLITDSIKKLPWKIYSETKQILGYTCRKAVRKMQPMSGAPVAIMRTFSGANNAQLDSTKSTKMPPLKEVEVVAWFAENIPVAVGPEANTSLPGAVLEVSVDNGATVFTAVDIKTSVDTKELKEPKKGKKITNEDFQKMMMEMLQNQMPGGFRIGM